MKCAETGRNSIIRPTPRHQIQDVRILLPLSWTRKRAKWKMARMVMFMSQVDDIVNEICTRVKLVLLLLFNFNSALKFGQRKCVWTSVYEAKMVKAGVQFLGRGQVATPHRRSGERCKFPQRSLGRSPSRNCGFLEVNFGIWWRHFSDIRENLMNKFDAFYWNFASADICFDDFFLLNTCENVILHFFCNECVRSQATCMRAWDEARMHDESRAKVHQTW